MTINQVDFKDHTIIISSKKRPYAILAVLLLLTIFSLLVPVFATVIVLKRGIESKIGLAITFMLFGGTGIYFIRMILWNLFGQVVIKLTDGKLEYFCDYKFFKDNLQTLKLSKLKIDLCKTEEKENEGIFLKISDGENEIETTFKLLKAEGELIEERIKNAL
jgi:hypothetical protein